VAWKLGDSISRPVRELARASETIARGDFCEMVPVRSSDEISALARTFNAMAASLRQRDEQLKERTRQQLTRSERLAAVGRLAAGVAHEINNPLTGVLTFSHMLLRDAPAGSQQHEDIEAIIEATTRCRDIIRGLLNFSRQNEPQKRLSNLSDVLHDALNLTRNQALLHRVTLLEQLDPHLPALVIDPHQVQEVAVNIILNAIDAMPDGGALNIRSHAVEGGRWVEFEMADTGHGIPAEILDRIFDPFFTTKPPGKGTGLGLAISYGIITEHGGDISVSSEVGRGTTVTVRLPVERKKEEPNAT
jgi:two-component system NtrC family sensor kinase